MSNEIVEKKEKKLWKLGKKNLAIVLSVLLIGGAIALNWILFANPTDPTADGANTGADLTLNQEDQQTQTVIDYFAQTAIDRQRARDEAMEVLQTVVDSTDAQQEIKDQAYEQMTQIAKDMQTEANIESLVIAKGFEDCVAVINEDTVKVIVKSEGLLQNEIVQIQEIVYLQSGILPKNVQIIEKA